jgi:hypothetical protein
VPLSLTANFLTTANKALQLTAGLVTIFVGAMSLHNIYFGML